MPKSAKRLPEFNYSPGTRVIHGGREWIIRSQFSSDQLLLESTDGTDEVVVRSHDVSPREDLRKQKPIDSINPDDLEKARYMHQIVRPVLEGPCEDRGRLVKEAAKRANRTPQTIYRWIREYEKTGTISSLAPKRKGSQRGQRRIDPTIEAIIDAVIKTDYLTKQRKSIKTVYLLIRKACADAGIKNAPSKDTVARRIKALPAEVQHAKRHGIKAARDKFGRSTGKFPGAERPLQTVQMDHTKLDINVVSRETGDVLIRPWLTISVDTFSGMLTGLHLSFDPPSTTSIGMCLHRSVIHKDDYLMELGVEGRWPVWGLPTTLHVDNGRDFDSNALRDGCAEHGIQLEFRPVKRPEFGGHVERAFRTINDVVHELPGTTRSNVQDRGEYNSEKTAVLTIDQVERILVGHIVNVHHPENKRSEDGLAPLDRWERGIREVGQMIPIQDSDKFYIDFLPWKMRSFGRRGIQWDYVNYFDVTLKKWIGSKQKLKAKRDPRDISHIFVQNPDDGEYTIVNTIRGFEKNTSLAEFQQARESLRAKGNPPNENRVFEELKRRQEEIEKGEITKRESKKNQRRREQKKRNKRDLSAVKAESKSPKENNLKVISGGKGKEATSINSPPNKKFNLRKKRDAKPYEDW